MGWLFGWNTRKELADHLISGNGVRTIKHCFKGNNLWAVQECTDSRNGETVRFIALYLIKGRNDSRDGWGYKDMDESAGPHYYNCPLSYLDTVPDPGHYATEWREKVREWHAKSNRKFETGQRIKLWGINLEVLGKPYKGQTAYQVRDTDTGATYKMPKRCFKDVEITV